MPKISQKQELRQQLTPKQILKASLLQLNLPLLEQRMLQELEINPALELHELKEEPFEQEQKETTENEDAEDEKEDIEFEWEELLGEHEDYENPPIDKNEEYNTPIPMAVQESFSDLYMRQLQDSNATNSELKVAEQVLGNLDTQGYLTIEPQLIADRMEINEEDVVSVMYRIQRLDPPGVAARNMQECLLAQAEYRNENALAIIILQEYFDDFANHRYEKILENSTYSKDELNEAMEFIARLNPSPRDDQLAITKDIIIPDISVEDKGGIYDVSINESVLPEIRVSPTYLTMLESHKKEKDVIRFVKQKVESANWFVEAVKERKHTIHKVMESIIKHQPEYFQSSDRVLRPMILKDIAEDIDMDISTISRVTNGKYVQLPWAIKELKEFFSEGIEMQSGEAISNIEVKARLKDIIESEDKTNPFDDEKLTEKLNLEGFKIARRTIAKYREQLKFPTARLRRKI
tara:strand:- start:2937 stop:4328 length:1392 start_codon:yes stop_codon:yes gene_type:complete